ncbi:MAG: DedA family protein [Candidatus Aenigmarchaeota archaeon]|nr:DedA family protein [Candidatus Aenigmarchaeota archaeon]
MVLEFIVNWALESIAASGYMGVFLLMVLESALMPVPSEVVMPFAGFAAYQGKLDFWTVVLAGGLGNLIGSWIAYWAGLHGGRRFLGKYGHYFLIKMDHLDLAENWFTKYGKSTAFFSRLMPVVRTFISLPAGIGKMNFTQFSFYTVTGSMIWSALLTYIGFYLGPSWESILSIFHELDIVVAVGAAAVISYIIYRHYRKRQHKQLSLIG